VSNPLLDLLLLAEKRRGVQGGRLLPPYSKHLAKQDRVAEKG